MKNQIERVSKEKGWVLQKNRLLSSHPDDHYLWLHFHTFQVKKSGLFILSIKHSSPSTMDIIPPINQQHLQNIKQEIKY